jgi:hypothetical protein
MDNDLFSHPLQSEYARLTYDSSSDPVENPVFSDKQT